MNIEDISKQFALLSRIKYGNRVRSSRDWLILLGVAFFLLVLVALWSTWIFLRGAQPGELATPSEETPSLAPELLEEAETLFEARAQEVERYRQEYRFVDPAQLGS